MSLITRAGQISLTLTLGLCFGLIAFNNAVDYGTNFQFVKHVLSMDSLPPDPRVAWHAVKLPALHHLAYLVIIAWEALAAILCLAGGARMAFHVKSPDFNSAKKYALCGLWAGVLLWSLGFITIGGEWFMMWESPAWNGELAAFRMFTVNSVALLFLYLLE